MSDLINGLTSVSFEVPAMSFAVKTKNVFGKQVVKRDKDMQLMSVSKIVPKERPRFGRDNKGNSRVFTPKGTHDFEAWIRRHFFLAYPSCGGVYWQDKGWPVADNFLGCRWWGEERPCQRYFNSKNFLDCQACTMRRKNLSLTLEVHLKDERHMDLDNVMKIVLDAMNHVCYYDDTQFVDKHVTLVPYSAEGEHLKVRMEVQPAQLISGSVVGGYAIKNMIVERAKEYIFHLVKQLTAVVGRDTAIDLVVKYVRRCDSRKYTDNLESWLSQSKDV